MPNTTVSPEKDQDLCLSCGLCCDGTIFRTVDIDDMATVLRHKSAGIAFDVIDEASGKPKFKQPCTAYQNRCCAIYADRPAACRIFECHLLHAYSKGRIDYASACETVRKAKDRRDEISRRTAELPLKSKNITFALYEEAYALFRTLEAGELKRKCSDLILQIAALRFFISANFKRLEEPKLGSGREV